MKKMVLFVLVTTGIIFYGCAGNQSGGSNMIGHDSFATYTSGTRQVWVPPPKSSDGHEVSPLIDIANFLRKLLNPNPKGASPSTDDEKLIQKYEANLANSPQDYEACIMLASLYINRGNYGDADAAIKYSNQALAIRNDDTNALYVRGLAYFEKGDTSQAMNDLNVVLKTDIRHMKGVYYAMGLIYNKDNKIDKAIEAIEKVKTIDPEYLDTDMILEVLHSKQNGN